MTSGDNNCMIQREATDSHGYLSPFRIIKMGKIFPLMLIKWSERVAQSITKKRNQKRTTILKKYELKMDGEDDFYNQLTQAAESNDIYDTDKY